MGALLASVTTVVIAGLAFVGGGFAARPAGPEDPNLLSGSAGVFDVEGRRDRAAEFRAGYRWERHGRVLRPLVAAMITSDGSSYACGGVAYDLPLGHRLLVTPSFAPGLYARGGGFDLGNVVEFRSQLAIDLRLGRSRIGVSFSHMSNAHLGARNPGVEALVLNYTKALR
jgi:lipid A 3-O-deacylase